MQDLDRFLQTFVILQKNLGSVQNGQRQRTYSVHKFSTGVQTQPLQSNDPEDKDTLSKLNIRLSSELVTLEDLVPGYYLARVQYIEPDFLPIYNAQTLSTSGANITVTDGSNSQLIPIISDYYEILSSYSTAFPLGSDEIWHYTCKCQTQNTRKYGPI